MKALFACAVLVSVLALLHAGLVGLESTSRFGAPSILFSTIVPDPQP